MTDLWYVRVVLGRRTDVDYSGTAFAAPQYLTFGYNDRSELDEADRWSNSEKTTHMATPYAWDYAYDHIGNSMTRCVPQGGTHNGLRPLRRVKGNREDSDDDVNSRIYLTNNLNQYVAILGPGASLDYDPDGKLTYDGTFVLVYDGENRLIEIWPLSPDTTYRDTKLVFDYDYMGRRVCKRAYDWTGMQWSSTPTLDQRFIYDEWNVIEVLDGLDHDEDEEPDNTLTHQYTWGLDLSNSVHGAGGVGGLLASVDMTGASDESYWYTYDANGNVAQLMDATTPSSLVLAAHYEYDPYGNALETIDADLSGIVDENPIRFSTKWLDTEQITLFPHGAIAQNGLYYYGYRYYSPTLGRWMNRDPIEERGGLNLYGFVKNAPVDWVDSLGNARIDREWPSEVQRDLSIKELRKLEKLAKGKAKAAFRKARKLLEEAKRLREQLRGGGRTGRGRGGGGAVGGAIVAVLTLTKDAYAPELPWPSPPDPTECGLCKCKKYSVNYVEPKWYNLTNSRGHGHKTDSDEVYEGRTTYKDCKSREKSEERDNSISSFGWFSYTAHGVSCRFTPDSGGWAW